MHLQRCIPDSHYICSRALAREQRVCNAVLAAQCERRHCFSSYSWTAWSEWGENPHPFTIKSVAKIWVRNWDSFPTVPLQECFLLSWQNTGKRRESSLLKCNRGKSRNRASESENTEIFPFIFNMQVFLHPCFISHNIITCSLAVAVHAHIASKMGSPPFSSYCFLQQRTISSLSATNNTLEGTPRKRFSLCEWW